MHTELLVVIQPLDLQNDCLKYKVDKAKQRLSVFIQPGKKKRLQKNNQQQLK